MLPTPCSALGDLVVFTIEATAFLRHMARNIIGTLVEVGHGQRPNPLPNCSKREIEPKPVRRLRHTDCS
jgi:tRNA U38,U39,U40 pseudouridine synthase TruA